MPQPLTREQLNDYIEALEQYKNSLQDLADNDEHWDESSQLKDSSNPPGSPPPPPGH